MDAAMISDTQPGEPEAASLRGRPGRSGRPIVVAALSLLLLALAAAATKSYRDLDRAWAREGELDREIAATRARLQEHEAGLDRLRHDPMTLERLAREELGFVAPGEVVIVLPETVEDR